MSICRRIVREIFFCLGGITFLIVAVPTLLPKVDRAYVYEGWSAASPLYVASSAGAVLLLAIAYAIHNGRRRGTVFAAFDSFVVLLFVCSVWVFDGPVPAGIVIGLSVLLALIWCIGEAMKPKSYEKDA